MRKFNIATQLNINLLNQQVYETKPNFLIMSKDTSEVLSCEVNPKDIYHTSFSEKKGYYSAYKGIPIAVCNILEFGEIVTV